jgi:hypothetical protein
MNVHIIKVFAFFTGAFRGVFLERFSYVCMGIHGNELGRVLQEAF